MFCPEVALNGVCSQRRRMSIGKRGAGAVMTQMGISLLSKTVWRLKTKEALAQMEAGTKYEDCAQLI